MLCNEFKGASTSKFRDPPHTEFCCKVQLDEIPEPYRKISMKLVGGSDVILSDNLNPIHTYMKRVVNEYNENPQAIQLGNRTTYSQVRYEKQKQRQEERPWLDTGGENLDTVSRVKKLKEYIDKNCLEKENKTGYENKRYPYFISSITESNEGLSVLITDLIGIKFYLKCAKNGVIGIDATGVGREGDKTIYWYALTVDIQVCIN